MEAEGLFDAKHKKPLRCFAKPHRVDHLAKAQLYATLCAFCGGDFRIVCLALFRLRVQGEGSAQEIARRSSFSICKKR